MINEAETGPDARRSGDPWSGRTGGLRGPRDAFSTRPPAVDSVAWEGFRISSERFARPWSVASVPRSRRMCPRRGATDGLLLELIHEEMEFGIKAGRPSGLGRTSSVSPRSPTTRARSAS